MSVTVIDSPPPCHDPREFVPYLLGDLVIDTIAQRNVDRERVRKIAHDFDWLRFETPTVVPIEHGQARVIEGQHRIEALRMIADETTVVMCAQLPIMPNRQVEAAVAYSILRGRRGHSALERWGLLVTMQQPHELAAERELHDRHLRLGAAPSDTTIAAVQSVSLIVHSARRDPEAGAALLGRALDVLGEAFRPDVEAAYSRWDGRLMRAVADVLARNATSIIEEHLIAVLRGHAASSWLEKAMRDKDEPVWQTLAAMMTHKYNRSVDAARRIV